MKRFSFILLLLLGFGSWAQDFLTLGSGGTNAAYFQVATGIAKLINGANLVVKVNARSTGGSLANLTGLASGDLEMGLTQNDIAFYAWNGKTLPAFQDKPVRNIKAVGILYPEFVQIFARADQKINSISELKGKRVIIGAEGSSNAENARQILELYGLKITDIQVISVNPVQALALMQDDKADAVFFTGALEAPAMTALVSAIPLKLLEIDLEHSRKLVEKYPFYRSALIPGNTYPVNPVSVLGVSVFTVWVVRDTVSADLVYQMMKATFDNPEFRKVHPSLESFSLKQALYNLPIPLHPGAERYYLEKGLIKSR